MPRQLSLHANYIINLLSLTLDESWRIFAIENMEESEAARLLCSSKIFMSFSDREGFSLPRSKPLFAAIA